MEEGSHVLKNTSLKASCCVTPRAWSTLSAIRWSRPEGCDVLDALEWSLEIARQVASLESLRRSPKPVIDRYTSDFGGTLRPEHVALGAASPYREIRVDELSPDLRAKLSYVSRQAIRTPAETVEWAADLAASTMCTRRAASALQLAVVPRPH